MLAEKLNMTNEEAEKWIVDLIRNARLDAKIDSKLVNNQHIVIYFFFIKLLVILNNLRVMLYLELKLLVHTSK